MAINNAARRLSAINVGRFASVSLPLPDGTIGTNERAHLAGLYIGVFAIPTPSERSLAVAAETRTLTPAVESRSLTVTAESRTITPATESRSTTIALENRTLTAE